MKKNKRANWNEVNSKKSNKEIMDSLFAVAKGLNPKKENYLQAYPHFINYFNTLNEIELKDLFIGISFTYSWMPTMLKSIIIEDEKKVLSTLNKVKKGWLIKEEDLKILKNTFNNSLVGTSKLLHFINPHVYAIWDSRVFRFICNEKPYTSRLERPQAYLKYLALLNSLKKEPVFQSFYSSIKKSVGYEVTENRALELAMFKASDTFQS